MKLMAAETSVPVAILISASLCRKHTSLFIRIQRGLILSEEHLNVIVFFARVQRIRKRTSAGPLLKET
jgi:hypothetical protein